MHLYQLDFITEHIERVNNIFKDLCTRWSKSYVNCKAVRGNIVAFDEGVIPQSMTASILEDKEIIEWQRRNEELAGAVTNEQGV